MRRSTLYRVGAMAMRAGSVEDLLSAAYRLGARGGQIGLRLGRGHVRDLHHTWSVPTVPWSD